MENEEFVNPIEDAFLSIEGSQPDPSKELFSANSEDINFKTDIEYPEDVFISSLRFADRELVSSGVGAVFEPFLQDLLKIRVSFGRQSRAEFVAVHSRKLNNFQIPAEFDKIDEARK